MTTHQVNLEYLAEAANLLMGPQGAMQLSVVYTTIENVAKRHYEAGERDGEINGYEQGYVTGRRLAVDTAKKQMQEEREEIDEAYRVADELLTLNEAAHGDDDVADIDLHKAHYDTWNGRFHRPKERSSATGEE